MPRAAVAASTPSPCSRCHAAAPAIQRPSSRLHWRSTAATAAAPHAPAAPQLDDEHFMRLALQQAALAFEAGEVPIGAVLVINSEVAAAAYNQTETRRNPLCHAEMLCISAAAEQQLAWRLQEATLYSSVEPCPMCAGAILQARLARLVYGARQPRLGADGSWVALLPQQDQQDQGDRQQQQLQRRPPIPNQQQQHHELAGRQQHHQQQQEQSQAAPVLQEPQQEEEGGLLPPQPPPQQQQQQQQLAAPLQPVGPHPFHPNLQVTSGVLADESAALMKAFFRQRRQAQKKAQAAAAAGAASEQCLSCDCQSQQQQTAVQHGASGVEDSSSSPVWWRRVIGWLQRG